MKSKQWVLARRPQDKLQQKDFQLQNIEIDSDDLQGNEILVRNRVFGMAPTMRNWLNDSGKSYRASINIGDPLRGLAAGEIIRSKNSQWPVGMKITCLSLWQEYFKFDPGESPAPVIPIPEGVSLTDAMGVFGANSLTAYLGLIKLGEPKGGETLLVSGAAGSVGSMVTQIGKVLGCRVIAIAGGREKCDWLTKHCGADVAIDYKAGNVAEKLAEICPDGVDIFFDNVGGELLQAAVDNIARRGRILVCGQISAYDSDATAQGPKDMMKIVYWSVKIQGFLLGDFTEEDISAGQQQLVQWLAEGKLVNQIDIREGFENLPATLMDIFKGGNLGTLMLKI
jgi:NADPH-dependent curcumin reductase CurA